jgi:nucleotide-binding universal stress UspA family protein
LIVAEATKCHADLIVMGTHGRRGLRRLALGSDAEEVVRLAPVPVLLVRDENAASPTAPKAAE